VYACVVKLTPLMKRAQQFWQSCADFESHATRILIVHSLFWECSAEAESPKCYSPGWSEQRKRRPG